MALGSLTLLKPPAHRAMNLLGQIPANPHADQIIHLQSPEQQRAAYAAAREGSLDTGAHSQIPEPMLRFLFRAHRSPHQIQRLLAANPASAVVDINYSFFVESAE